MATIAKIRKRSGLIIVIIGVAIVAFVLSDAIRSNQFLFRDNDNTVGVIAGEEVPYEDYRQMVDNVTQNYKNQRQVNNLSQPVVNRLESQAWDQLIFDKLFSNEKEALGLNVTSKELFEMVQGTNPHPSVKRAFTNQETGEFNRNRLLAFLKNMDREQGGAQAERMKQQWLQFEKSLVEERMQSKYFDLMSKGFYVTELQARENFKNQNQNASFELVGLRMNNVPDTAINVTENDLQTYYNNNQQEYQTEAARDIEYVAFDVTPTRKDSLKAKEWAKGQIEDFRTANNDSLFVELNTNQPFDTVYKAPGKVPSIIKDEILNSDTGDVIGPYLQDGKYKATKIIDTKPSATNYHKASHILIKPKGSTNQDTANAMDQAENILNKIREGASFASMAKKHGTDATASKGGDLGWFQDGEMVGPFNEAVKDNEKGDMFTVKTKFGVHVVKVTGEPINKKYQIGTIAREIIPSSSTYEEVYSSATKVRAKINNSDDFNRVLTEEGLNKRIADGLTPEKSRIPGLSDPGRIIQWAFTANEGDVSDILELDQEFIIAHLKNIQKEGVAPLADVKDQVRQKVIRNKKLDHLKSKIAQANENGASLDQIAQNLETSVTPANNVKFSSDNVPNFGREPTVIGRAFGLDKKETSKPFTGDAGAYQITLNSLSEVDIPKTLKSTKNQMLTSLTQGTQTNVIEALKDQANIKDQRYKFY